jgi:hypothetical protein
MAQIVCTSPEYQALIEQHTAAWQRLRTVKTALKTVQAALHGQMPQRLMDEAHRAEPLEERVGYPVDPQPIGTLGCSIGCTGAGRRCGATPSLTSFLPLPSLVAGGPHRTVDLAGHRWARLHRVRPCSQTIPGAVEPAVLLGQRGDALAVTVGLSGGPGESRLGEHPRGTDLIIVDKPTDDHCVPVIGERDGTALGCGAYGIYADQFRLLAPNTARAREHPYGAGAAIVR